MHVADWIALLTPALAVATAGYAGVAKLTRMAVAIEQLAKAMATVAEQVSDHEKRITTLEKP